MKKNKDLIETNQFIVLNKGNEEKEIQKVFCCDLLSIAMAKAPTSCAWVTIMANVNSLAVASLADMACIIFAEGMMPDEATIEKAKQEGITILCSEMSIFDSALWIEEFRKK